VDALPDLASLTDDDLDRLIQGTEDEEESISQRRRRLHERIDALRGERVTRLRGQVAAGTLATPAPETLERPIFEGTGEPPEQGADLPLPDLRELSDDELRSMVFALEQEEDDISLHRRVLHGRIDILRAERERRRRGRHVDPEDLGPILGGPR
jgi:anti-sigma-K factor RsiG